jgi:hypothetical protein
MHPSPRNRNSRLLGDAVGNTMQPTANCLGLANSARGARENEKCRLVGIFRVLNLR